MAGVKDTNLKILRIPVWGDLSAEHATDLFESWEDEQGGEVI